VRILALENSMVLRGQQCLSSFEEMFPDQQLLKSFSVAPESAGTSDPQALLGGLWKELEQQDALRRELEGQHQRQAMPLAWIARALGRTVVATALHFALTRDLVLHTAAGDHGELSGAFTALIKDAQLVLDPTAVATLHLLKLHERIRDLPFRLIIPNSVLDELRVLIRDASLSRESWGSLGVEKGRPVIREHTVEELAGEVRSLEALLEALKASCEVVGGSALLSLESGLRDALVARLGGATADAIAIAKERNACLWTDDLATGLIARAQVQSQRVWTQPVLSRAEALGRIPMEDILVALGDLLLMRYTFTALTPGMIVLLLMRGGWSIDHGVGRAVYSQACQLGTSNPQNCRAYGLVLAGIWARCPSESHSRNLVTRFLDGMGSANSGPLIARPLYRCPIPLYGMTRPKMVRFRRLLRTWRCSRG